MFNYQEWDALTSKLISLTQSSLLNWTFNGEDLVAESLGFKYLIGSVDGDGRVPFFFSVKGERDRGSPFANGDFIEIDQIDSTNTHKADIWSDQLLGDRVSFLRELALREAEGAPRIFSELLASLEGLESSEPPF